MKYAYYIPLPWSIRWQYPYIAANKYNLVEFYDMEAMEISEQLYDFFSILGIPELVCEGIYWIEKRLNNQP